MVKGFLKIVFVLASFKASAQVSMPDPSLTPGAWDNPPTPIYELCDEKSSTRRHVSEKEKKAVMREYGISFVGMDNRDKKELRKGFEIDHLIPIALGGSNDIQNLWPETYFGPKNAHMKDKLEDFMWRNVCKLQDIPDRAESLLKVFQHEIATDWYAAYIKYGVE